MEREQLKQLYSASGSMKRLLAEFNQRVIEDTKGMPLPLTRDYVERAAKEMEKANLELYIFLSEGQESDK